MIDRPLVSVGIPVRNGAPSLARALQSIVNQTYRNLEIIISDNASTDDTGAICMAFAARDSRIRYVRQAAGLTALANFRFVFAESHGNFFMWAAYDDMRSDNYIETLLAGFDAAPSAALCFSDVREFAEPEAWRGAVAVDHQFETAGLSLVERVKRQTTNGCTHVYGLLNARLLRHYPWYDIEDGPDVALLLWLGTRGPMIHQPGTTFFYYRPAGRDAEARAQDTTYGRLKPFHKERLAWLCARAVADASTRDGRPIVALQVFPTLYWHICQGVRGLAFRWLPRAVRARRRRVPTEHALTPP